MNEKLTAYALNELPPDERAELEAQMKDDPKLREEAEAMKAFCAMLESEVHAGTEDTLDPEQRNRLVQTFQSTETKVIRPPFWRRAVFFNGLGLAAAACVALMFAWREVKEASQSAKDRQLSHFAYKAGASDAPAPVQHPSETVTVRQAAAAPQPEAPRRQTRILAESKKEIFKANPLPEPAAPVLPTTPPLVGSGPLAPADGTMKLKQDQNHLWYGREETKTGNGTLTLNSPGVVTTGGSATDAATLTFSSSQSTPVPSPTLTANGFVSSPESKTKAASVNSSGAVSNMSGAQTASPALNVNGNPPEISFSPGALDSTTAKKAKGINPTGIPTAPVAGENTYFAGVTINGGIPPAATPAQPVMATPPPADPYISATRRNVEKAKRKELPLVAENGIPSSPKMLNDVSSGWEKPAPAKPSINAATTAAPDATPTAGGRAGGATVNPDSIDGLVTNKTRVASADKVQKDVTAKDRDALAKETEELKKQIEEMSTRSYQLSVQEAQRRILEEKLLRDRLITERLQRERRQQQYIAEQQRSRYGYNTATYRPIAENQFSFVSQEPLSTFSTDVDTASYANARRFLNANERPPGDAIRLEELINYFPYAYPAPEDDKPLAVKVDIGEAPWQPLHRLVRIAIKAREVKKAERPAANFTFLLDVSGSMSPAERLPLVKKALRLLVDQLREDDRVSIVTYAGESGLALESTAGNEKEKILEAIDRLNAEGSTNGAGGIRMAYEQAVSHYKKDGINRIILCTDGDFNVGTSNVEELKALITEKAKTGVFLSVLGVGTDNLHDFTMQTLADCGNGNYHYLDSLGEARKVLGEQMTANMITVAKDVKVQVEFNPAQVAAYRLIGYEKRMLEKEDFNNDKKDAGDIGAGHTITALYEIVPADLKYPDGQPLVDDLKYNKPAAAAPEAPVKAEVPAASKETMTVKLRYKEPHQDKSKLMVLSVTDAQKKLSENDRDFQFATSVAGFGMLLRGSPYGNDLNWDTVRQLALSGKGDDDQGWRGEFIQLIEKARGICER